MSSLYCTFFSLSVDLILPFLLSFFLSLFFLPFLLYFFVLTPLSYFCVYLSVQMISYLPLYLALFCPSQPSFSSSFLCTTNALLDLHLSLLVCSCHFPSSVFPTYLCSFCLLQPVWPDWAIYWTLGKFLKPLATIYLPKSPTFLGKFWKGVKIYHFSSEIIFRKLYRHLAIFIWSHWLQPSLFSLLLCSYFFRLYLISSGICLFHPFLNILSFTYLTVLLFK